MISMRCFLISTLLLVAATHASADRKISPAAAVELERGEKKFRDKDYAAAIAAFDAGYALDPQPIFLYDKAQAQRLSGDCRGAIESYKAFLATNPPANEASRARKNIENCEALLPPPPLEPITDDEPAAAPPVAQPDRSPAPLQSVITEEKAWWHDRVGLTLVTTGVVALGVGAGFAIAARQAAADTALARDVDEWSDHRATWHRDRIIAGVAAGAGAALVTLAVIRFSVHDRTVRIAATPGGGAAFAVGGAW
jgi:tetratricopeptide (TPR) repeat protein